MRKFIGLAVVIAFLWVSAAPAEAVSLKQGKTLAKDFDYSSFYVCGTDTYIPDAAVIMPYADADFTPSLEELELRAVFEVVELYNNFDGSGLAYWTPGQSGEEISGLMYDLEVASVAGTWLSGLTINLTPQERYDTDSAVLGAGGRIDIWQDSTPDYSHLGDGVAPHGPADWRIGITGHDDHDDFPTASDVSTVGGAVDAGASLWLRGNWVPMFWVNTTPIVYQITTAPWNNPALAITGSGTGYWDVVVNNTNIPIADDYWGIPGSDVWLLTNLTFPTFAGEYDGWQAQSQDPVKFFALPEPATMSLLLVGLVGGAGAYLRRRRAA